MAEKINYPSNSFKSNLTEALRIARNKGTPSSFTEEASELIDEALELLRCYTKTPYEHPLIEDAIDALEESLQLLAGQTKLLK
jgi:hypothetical protein